MPAACSKHLFPGDAAAAPEELRERFDEYVADCDGQRRPGSRASDPVDQDDDQ